jgi:hypothetical protein
MAVKRDLAAEQRAVSQFRAANNNKLPDLNNPTERAQVYKLAYPPTVWLPDELKNTVDASLYSAGINKNPLSQTVEGSNLSQLESNVTAAQTQVANTSQPNEALRVLQEAIRTKSGMANQPLWTSQVFKEAWLTGMGSLNASLEAQTQKFESDFANFSNIIKQMSGTYKDMSTAALTNYQNAYTAYKDEVDRLQKIQDDLQAHKDAIEIMNQQYNNNIKLEAYKNTHPSVGDIKTGNEIGYENIGGEWMSKDRNTIISPSGNAYDWSTYNAVGTPAQQAAYIKSVQQSINSIGKLNNEQELSNYISNNMAGSNITAQDVINMSGKMGVGWEEVLWLIQKEANGGTSNVAKNNNNYGWITWSQSYQDSHPGVTKWTPRPASEWGYYVKFPTVQAGLEAVAEQFTKRKTTSNLSWSNKLSPLAKQIYDGTASMDWLTPTEQTKIKKEIANAGLVLQNLSTNDKTRIDKIVNQFDNEQIVKDYNTVQTNLGKLDSLGNTPTDDIARIYIFAKIMDPNSVVREGEYATVQSYATALMQKFWLNAKRVFNNSWFLTEEARKFLTTTLTNTAKSNNKQYDNVFKEYGRRIEKVTEVAGTGTEYLTDYSKANNDFSVVAPDWKTYTFNSQEELDKFKKEANIQ